MLLKHIENTSLVIDVSPVYNDVSIETITQLEEKYNATYLLETQYWEFIGKNPVLSMRVGLLFFDNDPIEEHSSYFIVTDFSNFTKNFYISDGALTVNSMLLTAVRDNNVRDNDICYYSRTSTHYNTIGKNKAIDGGRSYTRVIGNIPSEDIIRCIIIKDKFYEVK